MSSNKLPCYSSSSVQRATRINNIESTRLEQRIRYLERARVRQCRLTNQDIRLISTSIGYIQSSSGHSPEARDPEPRVNAETEGTEKSPCFMYGERIWSRKRKRLPRSISAFESSTYVWDLNHDLTESMLSSGPDARHNKNRPLSVTGSRAGLSSESGNDVTGVCELDQDLEVLTGRASTPRDRVTPRQLWEDDISEVTKKILKAQSKALSAKRQSVYQSSVEVVNSQASRNVRNLLRKIRISASPVSWNVESNYSAAVNYIANDQSPRRPEIAGQGIGRNATVSEILNQRQPTLSSKAWRSVLRQTSVTPMSLTSHRQMIMNNKKERNDHKKEKVNEKIKEFITSSPIRL